MNIQFILRLKLWLLLSFSQVVGAAPLSDGTSGVYCGSYDKSIIYKHKLIRRGSSIEHFELINIRCFSEYSGNYTIENLTGLTRAEFNNHEVTIYVAEHLKDDGFLLTIAHEIVHAEQYLRWMKLLQNGNEMAEKLSLIQSLVVPRGMNTSYQTLARLKKLPEYAQNTKKWLETYFTVRFCMEWFAYRNEYAFAETLKINLQGPGSHLRSMP